MEFDKQINQLQGALLVDGPSLADNVSKIFRQKNVDGRKIFMCLLLNTDKLVDASKLSAEQSRSYLPFSNFGHKVSDRTFIAIVDKCSLWHFFFEAIAFIPLTSLVFESDIVNDVLAQTAYVAALLRRARLGEIDSIVIVTQLDKLFQLASKETLRRQLLYTLYLTRISLSSEATDVVVKSVKGSSEQDLKRYFYFNVQSFRPPENVIVEKLLSHCLDLAKMVSVDIWCDLTEESTDSLLELRFLNFWTADESAPSNLQLLLGHYFHQVLQLLQQKDEIPHSKDSVAILQSFARKYERTIELNLDELSPEVLMRNSSADVAGCDVVGWQQEAYVHRLASLDKAVLSTETILTFLTAHSKLLSNFLEKFYQMAISASSDDNFQLKEKHLLLLESVLLQVTQKEAFELMQRHLMENDFMEILKTQNFVENCRVILNRSTVIQTAADSDHALIWLVMQDPKGFVQFLIDEASENGGKISVAVAMIKKFPLLARTDIFMPLILKIDSRQPTKTVANATSFLKSLVALWRDQEQINFIEDLTLVVFQSLLEAGNQISPQLEAMQLLVQDAVPKLSFEMKLILTKGLGLILANYQNSGSWNSSQSREQEQVLLLLHSLCVDDVTGRSLLLTAVGPTVGQYFQTLKGENREFKPCQILLILRQSYFDIEDAPLLILVENETDRSEFVLELASGMGRLLPKEFKMVAKHVKLVQSNSESPRKFCSPLSEMISAAELFFSLRTDLPSQHLEYVASCLGQALASGFESCIDNENEPNKLKQFYLQTTRLLHLTAKISPGLIVNLQMCLVNLVGQLLQQLQDSGEDFGTLLAPLYPLPNCEAKTLCLAKIQILNADV